MTVQSTEPKRQTKWLLLAQDIADAQQAEVEARQRKESLRAEVEWMRRTPFSTEGVTHGCCGGCGVRLHTEADFARHFTVPDKRFKNLGHCPVERGEMDREQAEQVTHAASCPVEEAS